MFKYWSALLILNSSAFSTNRAVPSAEQVLTEDSGSIEMLNSVAVCVGGVVSKLCVMKEVTGSSPAGCGVFFFLVSYLFNTQLTSKSIMHLSLSMRNILRTG